MTERKAQVLGLARALFNRDGFGTTSFRAIAAGLKMSPGHLHYHFKTKEALLTALFEAIVLETEGRFGPGIDFRALPAEWLRLQRSYAFFFRELPAILADYPAVRRRYRAIGRKRIEELTVLITALSASGIVIVEPEPGFFRRWAELLWHHCNSALMAVSDGDPESMLEVLILPMLSETGRGFRARFDGVQLVVGPFADQAVAAEAEAVTYPPVRDNLRTLLSTAKVDGVVRSRAPVKTVTVTWSVAKTVDSQGNIVIESKEQGSPIEGAYDDVSVRSGGLLYLATGEYNVRRFEVEPGAKIIVDSRLGPVRVQVRELLKLGSSPPTRR